MTGAAQMGPGLHGTGGTIPTLTAPAGTHAKRNFAIKWQKNQWKWKLQIRPTFTTWLLGSQAFGEKLLRAQTEPQPNWVEETAKLMAKHQEHVHRSGPSAIPAQGSSSSSFSGRSSQRTKTRQQTEASYATISSATVRGSSRLSARSSVTLGVIPASTHLHLLNL